MIQYQLFGKPLLPQHNHDQAPPQNYEYLTFAQPTDGSSAGSAQTSNPDAYGNQTNVANHSTNAAYYSAAYANGTNNFIYQQAIHPLLEIHMICLLLDMKLLLDMFQQTPTFINHTSSIRQQGQ